ncbi:unnamed protein product [Lepidochelys olivacea]
MRRGYANSPRAETLFPGLSHPPLTLRPAEKLCQCREQLRTRPQGEDWPQTRRDDAVVAPFCFHRSSVQRGRGAGAAGGVRGRGCDHRRLQAALLHRLRIRFQQLHHALVPAAPREGAGMGLLDQRHW